MGYWRKYAIKWNSEGRLLMLQLKNNLYRRWHCGTLITNSAPNNGSKDFTCPNNALTNVKIHLYQVGGDVKVNSAHLTL